MGELGWYRRDTIEVCNSDADIASITSTSGGGVRQAAAALFTVDERTNLFLSSIQYEFPLPPLKVRGEVPSSPQQPIVDLPPFLAFSITPLYIPCLFPATVREMLSILCFL